MLWVSAASADDAPPAAAASAPPAAEAQAPAYETTVTALRLPRPLPDVPSTVTVLSREEIDRTPALAADGLLRAVPSVGTFRRTPSLVADPTAQGLNLRGVGPSGVSRALVLMDGVPVNDPFGGWIYWRSLPPGAGSHRDRAGGNVRPVRELRPGRGGGFPVAPHR